MNFLADLRAVLRDPLYRWEVRRYWTWRRYGWMAAVLLAFMALEAVCAYRLSWWFVQIGVEWPAMFFTGWEMTFGTWSRVPLCVLAAVGAATAIAPDKVSGQLEQFVVTPLDPWRFALARYFGRLRGLLGIWLLIGIWGAALAVTDVGRGGPLVSALNYEWAWVLSIVRYLDLGLVILLNAAVGMCFSAISRNTVRAVVKTCLVCFLILPLVLNLPDIALAVRCAEDLFSLMPMTGTGDWEQPKSSLLELWALLRPAYHATLVALALWLFLRRARKAIEKTFYQPGE